MATSKERPTGGMFLTSVAQPVAGGAPPGVIRPDTGGLTSMVLCAALIEEGRKSRLPGEEASLPGRAERVSLLARPARPSVVDRAPRPSLAARR